MNLLKALEGLSVKPDKTETEAPPKPDNTPTAPPPEPERELLNVWGSVLERHERISNRVRSGTKK